LATPLTFIASQEVPRLVHAIVRLYRDHGDRSCRSRGRFKYLVHDWGIDRVRAYLEQDLGMGLPPPRPLSFAEDDDPVGWRQTSDGSWAVGLHVFDGLIQDNGAVRSLSALRALLACPTATLRVLPRRRLRLGGVVDADRVHVEKTLEAYGVVTLADVSPLRRWADACPGLPACNHAITEAHRLLPKLLTELERVLDDLHLDDEPVCVRVAACPAGCTRSYLAEIAIVGRTLSTDTFEGKYAIYVGGDRGGRRLAALYADLVPASRIVATLTPLFVCYKRERRVGETFGGFCDRVGVWALRQGAKSCGDGH
jgi:sulfite reductase (ferredoxin)